MTTTLDTSPARPLRHPRDRYGWVVVVSALAAAGSRLPFLSRPPGPDEGGFLLVGGQWHAGGGSLYGRYWVDRPPLLVTIFRWSAQLGGVVPLRLVGTLAAVLVVVLSADLARRAAGPRAAGWAAAAACAFLVSPLTGGYEVNGELLAAPFVLGGMSAVVVALDHPRSSRGVRAAAAAGVLGTCALLIKQNFADVGVFAVAAASVAAWRSDVDRARLRRLALAAAGGGTATLGVVAVWTVLHGTSLSGVLDAMYPFRFEAARAMSRYGGSHAAGRSHLLLAAWLVTGLGAVTAALAWAMVTRRLRGAVMWALVATIAFDGASIVLGGNFWLHYLVQLVGPVSVAAGVLAARGIRIARPMVATVGVLAVVAWTAGLATHPARSGAVVGRSVAASAQPGDSIVTAYGQANVVETSGLSSPYPYLWSLPVKTLDPHLRRLDAVLRGPRAPTWLVVWRSVGGWGLNSAETRTIVDLDYHAMGRICGHTVYLRDGLTRAALPRLTCRSSASSIAAALKEHLP